MFLLLLSLTVDSKCACKEMRKLWLFFSTGWCLCCCRIPKPCILDKQGYTPVTDGSCAPKIHLGVKLGMQEKVFTY